MANILLIEPDYYCKYPPLGLMKISYYHKEMRNDLVWFAKGELPNSITKETKQNLINSKYYYDKYGDKIDTFIDEINEVIKERKWDRVYISTLFTYEWEKCIETINYAKQIVNNEIEKIFVGGILATLMADEVYEETGIKPVKGLLTDSEMIEYHDGINIDTLTPDYSILDNIDYRYPASNSYFAYTTRGCGMNCEFCAVKTLEPNYNPYISIEDQINEIRDKYGEKKDLLLMDNNVLKSSKLNDIIAEIKRLGFSSDLQDTENYTNTYINPKSGKPRIRFVDFNQGLDAFLFTEKKVKLLSEVSIRPARIAFDHIEDEEQYLKALDLAVKYNITHLSNYLLYNGEDFVGKGNSYKADTPQDLYNRLRLNVNYKDEVNKLRKKEGKELIHIFSFPMRYRPLGNKTRGNKKNNSKTECETFVGKHWNLKYLRAIQRILLPTQGKGVSSKSFFEAAFGNNVDEFMKVLLMPESYIATRGKPSKIRDIEDRKRKEKDFDMWENLRKEWFRLYNKLSKDQQKKAELIIGDNEFNTEVLKRTEDSEITKLLIHYLSNSGILEVLQELEIQMEEALIKEIIAYISEECSVIFHKLTNYIIQTQVNNSLITSYLKFFNKKAIPKLLDLWIESNYTNKIVYILEKSDYCIDPFFLYLYKWSKNLNLLSQYDRKIVNRALYESNNRMVRKILQPKFDTILELLEEYDKDIVDEVKDELAMQVSFHLFK